MRFPRIAPLALVLAVALTSVARSQSAATKYVPSDTEVVFTVNFEQILASEVAQSNKELVQQARSMLESKLQEVGAQQYLQKAGVDLFRDLRSVTVAGPGTKDPSKVIVLIEGKFDP